jgi:hypothetical protein
LTFIEFKSFMKKEVNLANEENVRDPQLRKSLEEGAHRFVELVKSGSSARLLAWEIAALLTALKALCGEEVITQEFESFLKGVEAGKKGLCNECYTSPALGDGVLSCRDCQARAELQNQLLQFHLLDDDESSKH